MGNQQAESKPEETTTSNPMAAMMGGDMNAMMAQMMALNGMNQMNQNGADNNNSGGGMNGMNAQGMGQIWQMMMMQNATIQQLLRNQVLYPYLLARPRRRGRAKVGETSDNLGLQGGREEVNEPKKIVHAFPLLLTR